MSLFKVRTEIRFPPNAPPVNMFQIEPPVCTTHLNKHYAHEYSQVKT